MVKIKKTKFKGLLIFKKVNFKDKRGYFLELFKKKIINRTGAKMMYNKITKYI